MTKFADPKFSVGAPLTKNYAENYARTFPAALSDKDCTECLGTGCDTNPETQARSMAGCLACIGTGLRSWQLK